MAADSYYRTSNTALAAYLQTEGFVPKDTVVEPHPFIQGNFQAVFLFERDAKIQEYAHRWDTGQAEGNLSVFLDTYRATVKRAKQAIRVAKL